MAALVVMVCGCSSVGDAAPASAEDASGATTTGPPDAEPEDGGTSTTAAAVERDLEAEQAAIDAAMLTLSDLPDGWEQVAEGAPGGRENPAAQVYADCMGLDFDVVYPDGLASSSRFASADDESVSSLGVVYASEEVAVDNYALRTSPEAFDCTVELVEATLGAVVEASGEDIEIRETTVHPLLVTPIGDSAMALRVTMPVEARSMRVEGYIDQLIVRVGRVVIQVQARATFSPFDTTEVERYAALVVDRIAAADLPPA
ncbi:MAG: hypothetical protein S0880_17305 [Actinomycetota bacterium]|nr:hypothetical protein [Actinomycetota bacterium]